MPNQYRFFFVVAFFPKRIHALCFVTRSLIDRCQIVTDACKKMCLSLFGSLLNHLYHYTNKIVSVKPLFNLRYLF